MTLTDNSTIGVASNMNVTLKLLVKTLSLTDNS